jgi:hypothetical protein
VGSRRPAALPWFPIASRAQREVGLLVEMLADDRARSIVTDAVLASAVTLVGGASPADSAAEASRPNDVEQRVHRLALPPLPLATKALVVIAAVALLAVPTALLALPAL